MKNNMLLLRTLLLSTSSVNILKHTTDKKKKGKIIGAFFGLGVLYAMLMAYSIIMCIGYGQYGFTDSVPVMCALLISVLAFIFTVFKTNGYLFKFKEYDMLMALPFSSSAVAACKFLYMYVKSLPWFLSISLSMMIGYGIYARPSVTVYLIWIVLTLILPIIPMLGAAFIGFIIARISSYFKKNNIIQTILTFVFVLLCFCSRFFIESVFRDDRVQETLEMTSDMTDKMSGYYIPVKWFSEAVTGMNILSALLLIVISVVLFAVIFAIVGRSYRNINSALASHAAAGRYRMTAQKSRSVLNAIAFKELKRLTGSTVYMVNGAMGELMSVLFAVVTLVIGFDKIIAVVTENAPFDYSIVNPAIPFIIHFFIGMISTTVCSPSLEGKNYWIVKSLPIDPRTLYKGKMLFNMYLTVPFMAFSMLCLCVSARVPVITTFLYLILGFMLCAFSTTWGCVCGIKHMRLDWENEVEVIKQGLAVVIYMFPNMIIVMGLCVLMVILGMKVDHNLLALIMIVVAGVLAGLSYLRAMALAKKQ